MRTLQPLGYISVFSFWVHQPAQVPQTIWKNARIRCKITGFCENSYPRKSPTPSGLGRTRRPKRHKLSSADPRAAWVHLPVLGMPFSKRNVLIIAKNSRAVKPFLRPLYCFCTRLPHSCSPTANRKDFRARTHARTTNCLKTKTV